MHDDNTKPVSRKELHAILEQISDLLEDSLAQIDARLEQKGRKIKAEIRAEFRKDAPETESRPKRVSPYSATGAMRELVARKIGMAAATQLDIARKRLAIHERMRKETTEQLASALKNLGLN